MKLPRLYAELASWWPLLSPPEEYEGEARVFRDILASAGDVRTVLELGSGGGNNASHLKADFEMTLVDPSPGMLEVSKRLNPECEHTLGDMRDVRLGRTFDAVFVHDAIEYMTTEDDLAAALATCAAHLRPGGVVLLAPDATAESFREGLFSGGHDGEDRAMRWLEWTHPPRGTSHKVTFAFILRDADGTTRVEGEEHEFGLFPRATWLALMEKAGFDARVVPDPLMDENRVDLFFGVKT